MLVRDSNDKIVSENPPIIFTDKDLEGVIMPHDDAVVIRATIANADIGHVLVDQGSSADIMSYTIFLKMDFKDADLLPHNTTPIAFTGEQVNPRGYLEARITVEGDVGEKSIPA